VGNVHANVIRTANELRADIKAQMQSRVRWTESVQAISGSGIQTYGEVGSGTVLLGLIKRIEPSAVGVALGNPSDFATLEF
jgi:[acyl-carrier-protein] S-malonyltransferase